MSLNCDVCGEGQTFKCGSCGAFVCADHMTGHGCDNPPNTARAGERQTLWPWAAVAWAAATVALTPASGVAGFAGALVGALVVCFIGSEALRRARAAL